MIWVVLFVAWIAFMVGLFTGCAISTATPCEHVDDPEMREAARVRMRQPSNVRVLPLRPHIFDQDRRT